MRRYKCCAGIVFFISRRTRVYEDSIFLSGYVQGIKHYIFFGRRVGCRYNPHYIYPRLVGGKKMGMYFKRI
jgi:hypothetical protein